MSLNHLYISYTSIENSVYIMKALVDAPQNYFASTFLNYNTSNMKQRKKRIFIDIMALIYFVRSSHLNCLFPSLLVRL